MLKYKITKMVSLQDWNELVKNTYNRLYNLQQQEGCMSRGIIQISIPDFTSEMDDEMNEDIPETINGEEMGVKFQKWLERDPTLPVDGRTDFHILLFYSRKFYPDLQTVANDLYKKGLIEQGDYTINIDW